MSAKNQAWTFSKASNQALRGTYLVETLGNLAPSTISKMFGKQTKLPATPDNKETVHNWLIKARKGKACINFTIYDWHGQRWNVGGKSTKQFQGAWKEIIDQLSMQFAGALS